MGVNITQMISLFAKLWSSGIQSAFVYDKKKGKKKEKLDGVCSNGVALPSTPWLPLGVCVGGHRSLKTTAELTQETPA